jgi:hypothetical protein
MLVYKNQPQIERSLGAKKKISLIKTKAPKSPGHDQNLDNQSKTLF